MNGRHVLRWANSVGYKVLPWQEKVIYALYGKGRIPRKLKKRLKKDK